MATELVEKSGLRVAVEGCGHGTLNAIYASIKKACEIKGWDGVDLLIIGGDFQAVRNLYDMNTISIPPKYRELGDFHEYYCGTRTAPYLTIFVGGNHEASNYLWELYYGGWVAPNIYYLGAANVIRVGPLRIAGMSGIWKGYDYKKPHHERLPYNSDEVKTIYHIREIDTMKLMQIRTQVDVGISHDWPRAVEWCGNWRQLFKKKKDFEQESRDGILGSVAAKYVMDRLRPAYWFSAHMHIKFAATVDWEKKDMGTKLSQGQPAAQQNGSSLAAPSVNEEDTGADVDTNMDADEARDEEAAPSVKNEEEIDLDLEDMEQTPQEAEGEVTDGAAIRLQVGDGHGTLPIKGVDQDQTAEPEKHSNGNAQPEPVKNDDEIDLDMDEDSAQTTSKKRKHSETEDGIDADANDGITEPTTANPEAPTVAPEGQTALHEQESANGFETAPIPVMVSDDIRSQLPAAFQKPTVPERDQGPNYKDLPPPPGIANKTTYFLALDKCLPHREFLQIVDVEPISKQESNGISTETEPTESPKPIFLAYDKEWLAITRVFAREQPEGTSPFDELPPKKDNGYYEPLITEQETWVEENVVKAGKLAIPSNFAVTAPVHDPALGPRVEGMPREYPNPQTDAFCELLQIQNHFHATEEEIQARIAAGPKPEQERFDGGNRGRGGYKGGNNRGNYRGRGGGFQNDHHGGHRGGRGGQRGGGRGRGGDRGRGHSRGRGNRGNPNRGRGWS